MSTQDNAQANEELEMFEFSIDELPDLPEFINWPAGTYQVEGVSLKRRDITIGDDIRAALELTVKLESVVAFKPANATLPEVGATQSWSFFLEIPNNQNFFLLVSHYLMMHRFPWYLLY